MHTAEEGYSVPPNTPANGKLTTRTIDLCKCWHSDIEDELVAPPNTPASATHAGFSEGVGLFWFIESEEFFEDAFAKLENAAKHAL